MDSDQEEEDDKTCNPVDEEVKIESEEVDHTHEHTDKHLEEVDVTDTVLSCDTEIDIPPEQGTGNMFGNWYTIRGAADIIM